jgi:Family of unknown function (DUF6488)
MLQGQGDRIMSSKKPNYVFLVLLFIVAQAGMMTHVSRAHSQDTVTPLAVTQKGLERLSELISSKKLDQNWADTFTQVTVSMRNIKGFAEYVVKFTSASGSPGTVTLYYSLSGGYSGSNLSPNRDADQNGQNRGSY